MKKLLVLVVVFSLLLFACLEDEDKLTTGKFWALNISDNSYYQVDAQMLAENDLCYVWAEKGSGVTETEAKIVADAYKNDIYYKMLNTFGYKINWTDSGKTVAVLNTIQSANFLVTGETDGGKLTILLLDIKDDYQKGVNESFVAGYFWSGNLYGKDRVQYSNECDMIYIDTSPGIPGSKESNETLAHEMQHLMNFVGSVAFRDKNTDLWIDEGLSVTAEWVYSGEHSEQRLNWYNADFSELIVKGNNFFVWGNREEDGDGKGQYAVLDDYATVYLFFQWLRLQSDKEIYRQISLSEYYDYNAVIDAFDKNVSSNKYSGSGWEAMLKDWLAANYIRSSNGRYGYRGDPKLNSITPHYTPGGTTIVSLYPGEGVYSRVTESYTIPTKSTNINYVGLNGSAPIDSGFFSNGALLTYNANTATDGNTETGKITGNAPPSASIILSPFGSRSIAAGMGPFPISAGDMLRRKGKKGNFYSGSINFKIPDAYMGIIVNE